jgi:hypothetical protein
MGSCIVLGAEKQWGMAKLGLGGSKTGVQGRRQPKLGALGSRAQSSLGGQRQPPRRPQYRSEGNRQGRHARCTIRGSAALSGTRTVNTGLLASRSGMLAREGQLGVCGTAEAWDGPHGSGGSAHRMPACPPSAGSCEHGLPSGATSANDHCSVEERKLKVCGAAGLLAAQRGAVGAHG